ncbi:MAG: hypothetical protein MJE77_17480 [Proteobacteria bacterium]|nr:hypothetical protein [Pseudomonadota bacterium]
MTIRVGAGYHTFPVEHGKPVILDPVVPRNAIRAGLYHCAPDQAGLLAGPTRWLLSIARHATCSPCDAVRIGQAIRAVRAGSRYDAKNIATLFAVAEAEARLWGPDGIAAFRQAATEIRYRLQRFDLGPVSTHFTIL